MRRPKPCASCVPISDARPPSQPRRCRRRRAPPARLRLSAQIHGWLLLLPAAVLLVTFTHYPAVATIIDSFFSTPKGRRAAVFVGADNYQAMLDDPVFWRALGNNIVYAASVIPLTIALSLAMAIWVNGKIAGRPFLRLSFFTPTVLPMIAVANIWLFFYAPGYGLLDQMLGLFGIPAHNWLGDQHTALVCLIAVAVWKDAGFFMIFYLAALQQMSPQLAEAAAIEGAGRWYFFRRVTFPLLMPTTLFVLINAIINSFRLIDHIVVMTQGGPGQHHRAAAVLHLRSRLQVLGYRLCGDADGGAAGFAGGPGARPVPHPRPPDSLSMSLKLSFPRKRESIPTVGANAPTGLWSPLSRGRRDGGAGDRRRLAVGADLDPAARLCAVGGDPSQRLFGAFRAQRAADVGEFRRAPGTRRRSRAISSTPSCSSP